MTAEIDQVDVGAPVPRRLLPFDRPLDALRTGPGNRLAVLATRDAHKRVGRAQAALADAGVSDRLSIEARRAGSDAVDLGGPAYDDPGLYLRASPTMHMRGVATPMLVAVGERDAECPMPQSQEFATAPAALGVPDSFVVYPGEGHALARRADRDDLRRCTVAWFRRWFATP